MERKGKENAVLMNCKYRNDGFEEKEEERREKHRERLRDLMGGRRRLVFLTR